MRPTHSPRAMVLRMRGHDDLVLGHRTLVMGIVNCTPDSFYEGSRRNSAEEAVRAGCEMAAEGADLLDVGGESTRPGSVPITEEEESARVLPVIRELAKRVSVPISVDTYRAVVAREALFAGAAMVNDVSALRFDPSMAAVVAESGAPVVLMHMKGRPRDMQVDPNYDDLFPELMVFFRERIEVATSAGISGNHIIVDPGIGFGKQPAHSFELIARLAEIRNLGYPVLLGPSRKSFIGSVLNLPPEERLEGTAAAIAIGIANGADIVRVHDVRAMVRVARIADAITRVEERKLSTETGR